MLIRLSKIATLFAIIQEQKKRGAQGTPFLNRKRSTNYRLEINSYTYDR